MNRVIEVTTYTGMDRVIRGYKIYWNGQGDRGNNIHWNGQGDKRSQDILEWTG